MKGDLFFASSLLNFDAQIECSLIWTFLKPYTGQCYFSSFKIIRVENQIFLVRHWGKCNHSLS